MLLSGILNLIYGVVHWILSLLPKQGLPTDVLTGVHNFFASVYQFNGFFPVDTMFTLIKYAVYFWGLVLLWHIFNYFFRAARGN